jgi:hypothetical protein
MKRLLATLLLLSIPALATAQWVISETWTTYCDGGVEKVRSAFVVDIPGAVYVDNLAEVGNEWAGVEGPCFGSPGCTAFDGTLTPLGGSLYEYAWTWPRDCFGGDVTRSARLWYYTPFVDGLERIYFDVDCGQQVIVDNSTCVPLPVASKTWGAIKALYR